MASVVLVRPEIPENTGFVARLCHNFGFDLRLVRPEFNLREARSTANNAQEVLRNAVIFDSLGEAVEDLETVIGTKPGKGIETGEFQFSRSSSFVFGPESRGLSNQELEICDSVVHIDAEYSSLNLSHAAAIVMHEAYDSQSYSVDSERLEALESRTGAVTRKVVERGMPSDEELDRILGEL